LKKAAPVIGLILIVLGVAALAVRGVHYTKREEVLKLGPIQATTETRETVPIPPAAGVAAIVAGVALVWFGARKT
jgi:hypothetical protein